MSLPNDVIKFQRHDNNYANEMYASESLHNF